MGNLPDKTLHGGLFNNIFFEVSHSEKLNLRNPEQLRLFHLEVSNNLFVFGHLQQFIQRNIGQYVFSRAQIEEYELDGNAFSVGLDAMNVMKANANPGERDSGNDLGEILLFVFLSVFILKIITLSRHIVALYLFCFHKPNRQYIGVGSVSIKNKNMFNLIKVSQIYCLIL